MVSEQYEGCYLCDVSNPVAVEEHHLVPQRYNGTDQPENLVDLCGACHNKLEDLYDDGFYERLGVAVDTLEDSPLDARSGVDVDPAESFDRTIPPASDHIIVQQWSMKLSIQAVEDAKDGNLGHDYAEFIESAADDILAEYDSRVTKQRESWETFDQEDMSWWDRSKPPELTFWYEHGSLGEVPHLKIHNKHSNGVDYEQRAEQRSDDEESENTDRHRQNQPIWTGRISTDRINYKYSQAKSGEPEYPTKYRIHCAYCHTVFSQHEHSDMARHLRVRHGVENPYERQDSTFDNSKGPEDLFNHKS